MNNQILSNYQKRIATIRYSSDFRLPDDIHETDIAFNVFSANLENFISEISIKDHANIITDYYKNSILNSFDESFDEITEVVEIKDKFGTMSHTKPVIFCTFHFGSFRSIPKIIAKRGRSLQLLMSSNNAKTEKEKNGLEEYIEAHQLNDKISLVCAEEKTSAIKMIRGLKEGVSVMAYIDGNIGVGGRENMDTDKMTKVSFLEKKIFVRKGLAYISHSLNIPIIPVVSYRKADLTSVVEFLKPICPTNEATKEEYCDFALNELYKKIEGFIRIFPAQWTSWTTIHNFLDFSEIKPKALGGGIGNTICFNQSDFNLIISDKNCYIFDKRKYEIHEISKNLFKKLEKLKEGKPLFSPIDTQTFNELSALEILYRC